MSRETNRKILIGSVSSALDKRMIIGDTFSKGYLSIILLLMDSIEYCLAQYEAGSTDYEAHVKTLTDKLNDFKYKCPSVCAYKDKLIIRGSENRPPTIEDNTITIPFSTEAELLAFQDVVHNFADADNDYISEIIYLSKDDDHTLYANNSEAIINNEYLLPLSTSVSYKIPEGKKILFQNKFNNPCTAEIVLVDEEEYETSIVGAQVLEINSMSSKTILQTIESKTVSLPNDSIIYIHIDTTSMDPVDQTIVEDATIAWYTNFKIENPGFIGSMVINTTDNDLIDNDYAPGRGDNGIVKVLNSDIKDYEDEVGGLEPQEYWLQNPAEGLLRQAYKEGELDFANENEFYTWINGKSLVVLSFVDESAEKYHSAGISFVAGTVEPSNFYIKDYNNFIHKIHNKLYLFKGVLYPVTDVTDTLNQGFLLHSVGAVQGEDLTESQVDDLFGQEKVAAFGPVMFSYHARLANNPYKILPDLISKGWSGNFTKLSGEGNDFDEEELSSELDELLTETSDIIVNSIETIEIDSENLTDSPQTSFTLKVKDNNVSPLFSNTATITINHIGTCESVPPCNDTTQIILGETKEYIFLWSDLIGDPLIDKIRLETASIPSGSLSFYGIAILQDNLPIIVDKVSVDNGQLRYASSLNNEEDFSVVINYTSSYGGLVNYCSDFNTIQLDKSENTNAAPIVEVQDIAIELSNTSTTTSGTIEASVFYTGTGGYYVSWEQVSGPNTATLLNPNEEDLNLENLIEGVYTFKITVITDDNYFTVSEEALATITQASDIFLFGANITELENTASDGEVTIVLDLLQQEVEIDAVVDINCTSDNNDVDNFTYIAHKDSYGTLTSVIQNDQYEVIYAFEDLGTFNYDDGSGQTSWRVFRTNAPGAFADNLLLTLTFS